MSPTRRRGRVQALSERRDRLVQAGRVDEDQLRSAGSDARTCVRVVCGLSLTIRPSARHGVEQGRLAHVRAPDQGDEAAAHRCRGVSRWRRGRRGRRRLPGSSPAAPPRRGRGGSAGRRAAQRRSASRSPKRPRPAPARARGC